MFIVLHVSYEIVRRKQQICDTRQHADVGVVLSNISLL